MNALSTLPDRALRVAGQVGHGFRNKVPERAVQWIETGAALAAVKTGGKVATHFVRRNPAVVAAAVAGAGLLWLAARRRRQRIEEGETIESGSGRGGAKRVAARRAPRTRAPRKRAARGEAS